jgi:hypothetical protein
LICGCTKEGATLISCFLISLLCIDTNHFAQAQKINNAITLLFCLFKQTPVNIFQNSEKFSCTNFSQKRIIHFGCQQTLSKSQHQARKKLHPNSQKGHLTSAIILVSRTSDQNFTSPSVTYSNVISCHA